MPTIQYAVNLDETAFRDAVITALPMGVRRGDIPFPVLTRNTAKWHDNCAVKLGRVVLTDLDTNTLLIEARQTGVLVGYIHVCHIKDGAECKLNHLLGKPLPGLPDYV